MNAQGKITAHPTGKQLVLPGPFKSVIRLLVPREHGTWGLLLFPLISGAIMGYVAGSNASLAAVLWFLLTTVSAFLIYQPLGRLFEIVLDKSAFPAAGVHRNIIGNNARSNRHNRSFGAFPFAPWARPELWLGGTGMFLRAPAAR